jgi:hypothetical protein
MSDLNLQMVREFFELNLFHVLTPWQHEASAQGFDSGPLLFVEHSDPDSSEDIPFLLQSGDAEKMHRAVVEVRAWHADRFYPSVIEGASVLAHVVSNDTAAQAQAIFHGAEYRTILVISELPNTPEPRARSIQLLQKLGVQHILEFPTLLEDILTRISPHGHYAPSQTLQTMRILKRYNLVQRQQLEFAFNPEPPPTAISPDIDTETLPDESDDDEI